MKITLNDLIEELRGDMRSINHKTYAYSLRSVLNKQAIKLLSVIKPISQVREVEIENGVLSNESYFEAPNDMSEDAVINIRKCNPNRCECCIIYDRIKDYDETCNKARGFDIEYINGYKYVRFDPSASRCNPCGNKPVCEFSFTDRNENGHWNTLNGVTKLDFNGENLSISIKSQGSIKNTTMTPVQMATEGFVRTQIVEIDKPHKLSEIKFIYSNTGGSYTYTVTSRHNGTGFIHGKNLVKLENPVMIGDPGVDFTSLEIVFVPVNTTNDECKDGNCDILNVKLGCLSIRTTDCYVVKYYSNFIFKNPITGRFTDKITDIEKQGNYEINLDEQAYYIYYELIHRKLKYQGADENNEFDYNIITGDLKEEVQRYNVNHRSYIKKPIVKKSNYKNKARVYGW